MTKDIRIRGARASIPQGYILGRAASGVGPVQVISLADLLQSSRFSRLPPSMTGVPAPAVANPLMDGTVAVGTSLLYARQDHIHPTDTSRAPLASPTFTGVPAAPTAVPGTNTTQLATTAFVTAAVGGLTGTVTSVGLAAPAQFTITGSPVTTSGTLTLAWVPPVNNTVLAGQATAPASPSIVNRGVYNSGAVSGNSIAMGFTPTTGNWLVCVYFNDDFTAPAAGSGWTRYAKFDDGNSFVSTGIYYQQVGASPSSTITPVTGSAPANGAAVYELSSLPNGLPTDFISSQFFANASGSSPSFSSVSSTHTTELFVVSATRSGTGQTIAGTTYDASHNTGTGNARDVADAYVHLNPSTPVTPTITYATSNNVGGCLFNINFDVTYAAPTFRALVSADIPSSVALAGVPTSPTNGNPLDATTQIATDAFVQAAILQYLASIVTLRVQEDGTKRLTEDGLFRIQEN